MSADSCSSALAGSQKVGQVTGNQAATAGMNAKPSDSQSLRIAGWIGRGRVAIDRCFFNTTEDQSQNERHGRGSTQYSPADLARNPAGLDCPQTKDRSAEREDYDKLEARCRSSCRHNWLAADNSRDAPQEVTDNEDAEQDFRDAVHTRDFTRTGTGPKSIQLLERSAAHRSAILCGPVVVPRHARISVTTSYLSIATRTWSPFFNSPKVTGFLFNMTMARAGTPIIFLFLPLFSITSRPPRPCVKTTTETTFPSLA